MHSFGANDGYTACKVDTQGLCARLNLHWPSCLKTPREWASGQSRGGCRQGLLEVWLISLWWSWQEAPSLLLTPCLPPGAGMQTLVSGMQTTRKCSCISYNRSLHV